MGKIQYTWKKQLNKFLILICYYNRPNLVRFALQSLKNQTYKNWEAIFVDDGSELSAQNSVNEILGDERHKIKYINTLLSKENKESFGGSIFGLYWTHSCLSSDAQYGIMLCDDDALLPDYLENLNAYFTKNVHKKWCYSNYLAYDPYKQDNFNEIKVLHSSPQYNCDLNELDGKVDASQVCFSLEAFKTNEVEFIYPRTANLDSNLFNKLLKIYGTCSFCGFYGEFKGKQDNRLENRQHNKAHQYVNNIDVQIVPFR
jgi:glycosyltransferase involved in cell wall biosynthesis